MGFLIYDAIDASVDLLFLSPPAQVSLETLQGSVLGKRWRNDLISWRANIKPRETVVAPQVQEAGKGSETWGKGPSGNLYVLFKMKDDELQSQDKSSECEDARKKKEKEG